MNNLKNEPENQVQKFEEVYLDANIFVYSISDDGYLGEKARKIIEKVKNGEYRAFTATLTVDEFLWAVKKELDKERASKTAEDFLSMQNLEFINVDLDIIKASIENYKNGLDPRDAIHLAALRSKKIKIIISTDSDFDNIKGLKRIDLEDLKFKDKQTT